MEIFTICYDRRKREDGMRKNDSEFDWKKVMRYADRDPEYTKCLSYYQEITCSFQRILDTLPAEQSEIIEQYLTAGEALYFHFSRIAYQCGKQSRKQ